MIRITAVALLSFGCLQPAEAPAPADASSLLREASEAARACDGARAKVGFERAEAACHSCTPPQRAILEQARVELALMNGAEREPTLAAGARAATELEKADPMVAASLLAWLGRWGDPEYLQQAARTLAGAEPSTPGDARAVLGVLLTDPEFVVHDPVGRTWPDRYELQDYHWRAPDAGFARDDRYDLAACSSSSKRRGTLPDFPTQLNGQYIVYQACASRSLAEAPPGRTVAGSASFRLMTDPSGAVSRLDIHAARLPAVLVQCLGETLRNHQWPATPNGAIEEAHLHFRSH